MLARNSKKTKGRVNYSEIYKENDEYLWAWDDFEWLLCNALIPIGEETTARKLGSRNDLPGNINNNS